MSGRELDRSEQGGFTLIELLVALTILALAMGVAGSTLLRRGTSFEVRTYTGQVVDGLREARTRAMTTGTIQAVEFDGEARRFRIAGARSLELPAAIEANVVAASSAGRGRVLFYQNGVSSGGTIEIFSDKRRETITVDWLTGSIQREAATS